MRHATILTGISTIITATSVSAGWQSIQLDGYTHGQVLDGTAVGPATLYAENFHQPTDKLVAFDTTERDTRDHDLEGPDGETGQWARGNVDPTTILGTALIVQDTGANFAGYADESKAYVVQPDDEEQQYHGQRPGAGEITFEFDQPIEACLFTLIDIEPTQTFQDRAGSYVVFHHGYQEVRIDFADLIDPESLYYDPTIQFGDQSANRFPVIPADQMGLPGIDKVVINLGGSGAVSGLSYYDTEDEYIGFAQGFEDDSGPYGQVAAAFAVEGGGSNPPGGGTGGSPPGSPKPGGDWEEPVSVPTPSAVTAGLAIIGVLLSRRGNRKRG
ncbi:MAG: hypothetical protein AAF085_06960 [Planctomycetota bacterium]